MKENEVNLIDKYIAEVGKYLPRKNREDIQAEIRSTLEDMLEERKQTKGSADEATVINLLKEYGSPREVAATYKTHQYLIGPRMFPIFETVIKIVLAVVAGASLIGLAVSLAKTGWTGPEFASAVGEWFGGLISGLIAALGNVVLVFAILERTQTADKFEKDIKEWDPTELKNEPDPDQIDLPDHIATIIFTFLGLVILNLYPNLLAIRYINDGTWTSVPILTEAFFRFLPWINILSLLQIIFHGFMLGQRMWTPVTRIARILIDVAGLILTVLILRTPAVFNLTAETWSAIGNPDSAEALSRLFQFLPGLILAIVVIVTVISVTRSLLRVFSPRSPYPVVK